jgi:hypothetical protein
MKATRRDRVISTSSRYHRTTVTTALTQQIKINENVACMNRVQSVHAFNNGAISVSTAHPSGRHNKWPKKLPERIRCPERRFPEMFGNHSGVDAGIAQFNEFALASDSSGTAR